MIPISNTLVAGILVITAQYASYWGGAYFKVGFTSKTVKIKIGNKSNFYAKIDNGPWISYLAASGIIDLTSIPLRGRKHTLSVAQGKDYNYVFNFQGLILDAGAKTRSPKVSPVLIEYIDSITCGYTDAQADISGYGWVCSEALGTLERYPIAYRQPVGGYPQKQEWIRDILNSSHRLTPLPRIGTFQNIHQK